MGKKDGERLWEHVAKSDFVPRWGCFLAGVLFIIVMFFMVAVVR